MKQEAMEVFTSMWFPGYDLEVRMLQKESSPWDGNGTEKDPYLIETEQDLKKLADKVKYGNNYTNYYFSLKDDITLGNNWEGIGTEQSQFDGIFNGNGNTISNIILKASVDCGLFKITGQNAVIQEIEVKGNVQIKEGVNSCGAIVGVNKGCITKCKVTLQVKVEEITQDCYIGLFAGTNQKGKILECSGELTINSDGGKNADGKRLFVGGAAGKNESCIEACQVSCSGSLLALDRKCLCAAGVAAQNSKKGSIIKSRSESSWQIADKLYSLSEKNEGVITDCTGAVNVMITHKKFELEMMTEETVSSEKQGKHKQKMEDDKMGEQVSYISSKVELGNPGETHSLVYDNIVFTDDGYFSIYGNMNLTIHSVENRKEKSTLSPYEFRVQGDDGEDGNDSKNGEDGGDGKPGKETQVNIQIDNLKNTIKLVAIGGSGGNGGNGLNGQNGGDGGNAEFTPEACRMGTDGMIYPVAAGGVGGAGSAGRGNGGNGGNGGSTPKVTMEYGRNDPKTVVKTQIIRGVGGAGGRGGKGGAGGHGGKNGDGVTYARNGRKGKSCRDGAMGQKGEIRQIEIQYHKLGGDANV